MSIGIQHYNAGELDDADSVKLRDATGTYGIRNRDTGATVVSPTVALDPTTVGSYTYDTSTLAVGNYEAVWEIIDDSHSQYYPHSFRIDALEIVSDGCRLKDIEQEVCRTVGPYHDFKVLAGAVGSFNATKLISSIGLGEYQDLFILRRGINYDTGAAIVGALEADRIRRVASYIPATGTIQPDNNWTNAPAAGELMELQALDPDLVRRATLFGLSRCYSLDTVSIATTAVAAERNLTASVPWLRRATQLRWVGWQPIDTLTMIPIQANWANSVQKMGQLWLQLPSDIYPNSMVIRALRPMNTLVNGVLSLGGPTDDNDILGLDVRYAASSALVGCWKYGKRFLTPLTRAGMLDSQENAARDFTRLSQRNIRMISDSMKTSDPIFPAGELV